MNTEDRERVRKLCLKRRTDLLYNILFYTIIRTPTFTTYWTKNGFEIKEVK